MKEITFSTMIFIIVNILETKALFDKLLKMFKPLKMKFFNGFNFSICLITKFQDALN